jgi:histidinol dehydrogenase
VIRRIVVPPLEALEPFLSRPAGADPDTRGAVSDILQNVQARGDAAVQEYTLRFDGVELAPSSWELDSATWHDALERIPGPLREALNQAVHQVSDYHQRQRDSGFHLAEPDGSVVGMKVTPLDRVGLYLRGRQAASPSLVVMHAVPALVAGVQEIIAAVPPRGVTDGVLAAFGLSGVTRVFRVGGAQAIAALAYGTRTIPRADKIVGRGGRWVAEAKRQVAGHVGIDTVAGASELLIVADATAHPERVAADMIAQTEHDDDATSWCVTTDADLAAALPAALEATLDRASSSIARASLERNGLIILAGSMRDAIEVVNRRAPERVQVVAEGAERIASAIRNAGAIFLGDETPESVHYLAGPSHVLPAGGTARYASPLGVYDFVKRTSVIRYASARLARETEAIIALAEAEGLYAHAEAVRMRMMAGQRGGGAVDTG